jgi:SAM-dependent methyltransferase
VIGVDNSSIMLDAARAKFPSIRWQQSDVTTLPFPDGHFAGAICTLAIHHFPDLKAAILEINRVLGCGRFVIFTATRDQMRSYWLNAYFPEALRRSIEQFSGDDQLRELLEHARFYIVSAEPWFVPEDPIDPLSLRGKIQSGPLPRSARAKRYLHLQQSCGPSRNGSWAGPSQVGH